MSSMSGPSDVCTRKNVSKSIKSYISTMFFLSVNYSTQPLGLISVVFWRAKPTGKAKEEVTSSMVLILLDILE